MLAFELAMLKSRGNMDSDEGKAYLEGSGLLHLGEWDHLVPGDRHTTVFWWIQLKVHNLRDEDIIRRDIFAANIFGAITDMRARANDMMSSLDRDQPFPYTALCGALVAL